MTPSAAARLLADMFRGLSGDIKVLDAGAGFGVGKYYLWSQAYTIRKWTFHAL